MQLELQERTIGQEPVVGLAHGGEDRMHSGRNSPPPGSGGRLEGDRDALEGPVDGREEEILLAAEEPEHVGLGDPRKVRDRLRGRAGVAAGGKCRDRSLDDLGATLVGGDARAPGPAGRCWTRRITPRKDSDY